ncbi:MAG TPA: hypothetical protein VFH39_00070, partial [Candidatus Saccharimonadales bacterium]|nr:hypothetical protein [Candidatus Saccharimonadales bacterium]
MSDKLPCHNNPERLRDELIRAQREQAAIAQSLGESATAQAAALVAIEQSGHRYEVEKAERTAQDRALVCRFLDALPAAANLAEHGPADPYLLNFASLAQAKVAESLIWHEISGHNSHRIGYLVGQKAGRLPFRRRDERELLFAFRGPEKWTFDAKLVYDPLRQKMEELALQQLAEEVDSHSISRYLSDDKSHHQLRYEKPWSWLPAGGRLMHLCEDERASSYPRKVLSPWVHNEEAAEKRLRNKGLRAYTQRRNITLDSSDIAAYSMDILCFRLATVLKLEPTYHGT